MGNRKNNKSTHAIVAQRVDVVTDLLLQGLTRREILQYNSTSPEMRWKVTARQIDTYMSKATAGIVADVKGRRGDLVEELVKKLEYIHQQQIDEKDYRGASKTLVNLATVAGITASYRKDETNINLNVNTIVAVPTE